MQILEGALVGVGVKGEDQMECGGGFNILQAEWSIWDAHGFQLSCTKLQLSHQKGVLDVEGIDPKA